jgi:hypothetical protein
MRMTSVLLIFLLTFGMVLGADGDDGIDDSTTANEQNFTLTVALAGVVALGILALVIFSDWDESDGTEVTLTEADDPVDETTALDAAERSAAEESTVSSDVEDDLFSEIEGD